MAKRTDKKLRCREFEPHTVSNDSITDEEGNERPPQEIPIIYEVLPRFRQSLESSMPFSLCEYTLRLSYRIIPSGCLHLLKKLTMRMIFLDPMVM